MKIENAQGIEGSLHLSNMVVATPSNEGKLAKPGYGIRIENPVAGNTITIVFWDDSTIQLQLSELDHGYHPIGPIKRINETGTSGSFRVLVGQ